VIRFRAFAKRFGAQVAVAGLDLEVGGGEVVALLGPNGSGKTTTVKAAAGLVRPSAGEVLLGEPGRPAWECAARRAISYLPQKVTFPEALTGREVVTFYQRLRGTAAVRVDAVLHVAALNGAADRAVGTYSGGMVQRLGLAVAALPAAEALLLDEPTAALDPAGLTAFYELVEQRRRAGRAVLFSSHQLGDTERLADRFAVLVDGRLVAMLTASELAGRLAGRGVMRVRMARPDVALLARLGRTATWDGGELVVRGAPERRGAVLAALAEAGHEVLSLTTEEGRLDGLYRELVGEEKA
jgi:Cu-processing system ATP-binding protein